MLVDPESLLVALRLPGGSSVEFEPLNDAFSGPERVVVERPGGVPLVVLLRTFVDDEAAMNHIAVMEALTNAGFPYAPRLLAVLDTVAVEEWVDGVTALAVVPPAGSCEAAIEALAALHMSATHEGLNWGATPADLIPEGELPIHRLGFAAHEREPALGPLAAAREAVLKTPFGFAHGAATAANILLAKGSALITNFEAAGYSSQYMDIAAFLLTSGLEAPARRALAAHYARLRQMDPFAVIDGVDLAGILWGIDHLIALPRRLIESLGDDAAGEALHTAAARVDRGIRTSAGDHPAAAAIRTALWPG